ncbi:MAG: hypothetical protein KDB14_12650 [Planctomycetales bacterium]|nr:hypothetical protein [Planctomycetales bacterium]
MSAADAVRVTNIRRVFHNGEHNAFTDLVRFDGRYYLTFRSCPDGHMVHPTASVIVMTSDDLREWRQVHRFQVPKRDTRDPHFLVFKGKLFVLTGTWYSGEKTIPVAEYDLNLHLGYAVWSEDGATWHGPVMLEGTFGHYIWRAAVHGDKAYLCGRRKQEFAVGPRGEGNEVQSAMLESDDGLVWRHRAVMQERSGDETAMWFEPDGSFVGIGRRGRNPAELLRSAPPYREWERRELDRYIGGPLLTQWDGAFVVGGRHLVSGKPPQTKLYWLTAPPVGQKGDVQLAEFASLPSAGDTSYPGFLDLGGGKAVVSWYSSHEQDADGNSITAIYMADLSK